MSTAPAKFRKKPVVIEAMRLDGGGSFDAIVNWLRTSSARAFHSGGKPGVSGGWWIKIETLEGVMLADEGDWIVRGVKGEFYPVKPDIFDATYEPADTNRSAQ